MTSLSILSSFSSTQERCWKKDISLRSDLSGTTFAGKQVAYDEVKDQLYVVKSEASEETLSLYVTSTSYSGVEGYFEVQITMSPPENTPPKFIAALSNIAITVKGADQLSGYLPSTKF